MTQATYDIDAETIESISGVISMLSALNPDAHVPPEVLDVLPDVTRVFVAIYNAGLNETQSMIATVAADKNWGQWTITIDDPADRLNLTAPE